MTSVATAPNTSSNQISNSDACTICSKKAYPLESVRADDKVYHKNCFRCLHPSCGKMLQLGNYAAMNGMFYCKPHFKQLFAVKGNYIDGFKQAEETMRLRREEAGKNPESPASPASLAGSPRTPRNNAYQYSNKQHETQKSGQSTNNLEQTTTEQSKMDISNPKAALEQDLQALKSELSTKSQEMMELKDKIRLLELKIKSE